MILSFLPTERFWQPFWQRVSGCKTEIQPVWDHKRCYLSKQVYIHLYTYVHLSLIHLCRYRVIRRYFLKFPSCMLSDRRGVTSSNRTRFALDSSSEARFSLLVLFAITAGSVKTIMYVPHSVSSHVRTTVRPHGVVQRLNELPLSKYGSNRSSGCVFQWHSRVTRTFAAFGCSCAPVVRARGTLLKT